MKDRLKQEQEMDSLKDRDINGSVWYEYICIK
jgi:hypothetical protein